MRWSHLTFLGAALLCLSQAALGELIFSVTATHKGKPIPKEKIQLKPFEFGISRNGESKQVWTSKSRKVRRANPTATSANWCGAVKSTSSSSQITKIHALYQHPGCSIRSGVNSYPQAVAPWVGIDGNTHTGALFQSGTLCKINNSTGIAEHEAWWQWVPAAAYTISSLTVSAGDWIEVTIEATSTTSGKVTIANWNTATAYVVSVSSGPTLGRVDADWVVERPYYGASLAPFAAFEDVWFIEAYAERTSGGNLGILGATQYQIPGLCASEEYDNESQVSWSL
ncbi:hypothetical protein VTJ04DRAFT_6962 [Mycothermus thermophilus]|uniref:uncharacterized protein n=1 Tax=Humicola insolens TaxID=85995 RepID=UPI003742B6A9